MYKLLWQLLIDARSRFFKEGQKPSNKKEATDKANEEKLATLLEMMKNASSAEKAKI